MMEPLITLAFIWLVFPAFCLASSLKDLRSILTAEDVHWSAGTVVAFPNTTEFVNATERRDHFGEPIFGASITPVNDEDVVKAVKIAVQNDIPFLATGGRHGSGVGYSKMQGGIAIDLSRFTAFQIHTDDNTVTIGGAQMVLNFGDQLSAAGLMLPHGTCSCPGYAGLAVGGGIGRYYGSLGLVADSMVSTSVVTATGDIVEASAALNADLFWGLRGAGANFGIILNATYQAVRKADHWDGKALTVDLVYSADKTLAYFEHLASLRGSNELPGNVSGMHIIRYNATEGRAELFVNWVWLGSEDEGHAFLSQFMDLDPYSVRNYVYVDSSQLNGIAGDGLGQNAFCARGIYSNTYSSNLRTYTASLFQETFATVDDFYTTWPDARATASVLEIFPNQAVIAKPHDFNAYVWRDAKAFISVSAAYSDAGLQNQTVLDAGDQLGATLRASWTEQGGYREYGGACYINYAHGDESLQTIYGDKLPRLIQLKQKWDPSNVFAFKNNLPVILGSTSELWPERMEAVFEEQDL